MTRRNPPSRTPSFVRIELLEDRLVPATPLNIAGPDRFTVNSTTAQVLDVLANDLSLYGEAGNVNVVQNDKLNNATSVSLTVPQSTPNFQIIGGNRGDYDVQIGPVRTDDVANGILITSIRELGGRDNSAGGDTAGKNFAIASADGNGTSYFIPVNAVVGNPSAAANSELNHNIAAGYFPYANGWIGGVFDSGTSTLRSSSGLTVGTHFIVAGTGTYTVNLSSLGISSQTGGVLLTVSGDNNSNYTQQRANADGTWTIFNVLGTSDAGALVNGDVTFVYVPNNLPNFASGLVSEDGTIIQGTGFTAVNSANGEIRLTINGYTPADGILLISPEGDGGTDLGDNIVTYGVDGNTFVIQTYDLSSTSPATLVDTNQRMFTFAFIPSSSKLNTPTISKVDGMAISVGGSVTLASGAKVTLTADGKLDYNPNGAFLNKTPNSPGLSSPQDFFSYTVQVAGGGTIDGNVTIDIIAAEDAPTANKDTVTGKLGDTITINPLANDTDPDIRYIVEGANLKAVQNDTANNSTSVTVTVEQGTPNFLINPGTNRGDYEITIGTNVLTDRGDDTRGGVLISTIASTGVDHGQGQGVQFGQAALASASNIAGSANYFIALHTTGPGDEYNDNVSAVYFPYANGWIGGHFSTTDGANGGANTLLVGSPGLVVGTHVINNGSGRTTIDLTSLGINSQEDGILLVNHGKNEDNYGLQVANADGTWSAYVRDTGTSGSGGGEQDPVAFVYVPLNSPGVTVGKFDGNAGILMGSGFTLTKVTGTVGTYRLSIPGQTPRSGALSLTIEAASTTAANFDNIIMYRPDGDDWIIEIRDITGSGATNLPVLEDIGAEVAAVFAFIPFQVADQANLRITQINGVNITVGTPVTLASGSQVTFNADNTFSYVSTTFVGTDTFTYTIVDPTGRTSTGTVEVEVTETNLAPVANDASFSVLENSAAGTVVGTVTASDPNIGTANRTLTYAITAGNTGNAFAINASIGEITVAAGANIDRETLASYLLTITVTDGGSPSLSANASVSILVTDVNEPPTAGNPTFNLPENSPASTIVGTVVANDPDTGTNGLLTFSITGGNTDNAFVINPQTGEITVATGAILDFETLPSYTLTVTVVDAAVTPLSTTSTVTINLTDVNEAPIAVDQSFELLENATTGTTVGTIAASDPDAGSNGTLSYAITGGNTGNVFAINATTGEISVVDPSTININTTPSYSLTITISDGGSPSLSTTITATITITDNNDPPTIGDQSFNVLENAANGTVVGTIVANDPDSGTNGTLTFTAIGGDLGGIFTVNESTGEIIAVNADLLDFETTPTYTFTVRVTDGGTPGLTATATITINVLDVNEAPTLNDISFSIPENSSAGTTVGTITGTDVDAGANGSLSYSITGGNESGAFAINPTTGEITVIDPAPLDFETTPSFTLTVTVSDAGSPSLTASATVTITLTDVNEDPIANSPQTFTVEENASNGTSLGSIVASDPDTGSNGTLSFAITGGNEAGIFAINASTGEITVVDGSQLDFETTPAYTLTIAITDGGSLANFITITAEISVIDVNEAPTGSDLSLSVAENSPVGTVVGTVTGSDPDTGTTGTLTYEIISGDPLGLFAIDPSTGEITVARTAGLDHEALSQVVLVVQIADGGSPSLIATVNVTIAITDVNEPVTLANASVTVAQNAPAGAILAVIAGVDEDSAAPNNTLTYAITGGNTGGAFAINSTTGQLTLANPAALGAAGNVFSLSVTVTDSGRPSFSATATIRVEVTPVNNAPSGTGFATSILENASNGTGIGTVIGSDPDSGNDGTLRYAITGGNIGGVFAIDAATGVISIVNAAELEFDRVPVYELTITVSDQGNPSLSASTVVRIDVIPVIPPVETRPGDLVIGADAGGAPRVQILNPDGSLRADFFAYDVSYTGGVRVALGDINGDGIADIITGTGIGGGPHIRIFDGKTLADLGSFFAYDPSYTGGLSLAVGDIDGDNLADIITGTDAGGGPHVKVFSGRDFRELASFMAYSTDFRGGVSVAFGGQGRIITGAGAGGGPHVKVFNGLTGTELASFFAYEPNFLGGVVVATNRQGEILTTPRTGETRIRAFDGATFVLRNELTPYVPAIVSDPNDGLLDESELAELTAQGGGVFLSGTQLAAPVIPPAPRVSRISATDINGDGIDEWVVANGPGNAQSVISIYARPGQGSFELGETGDNVEGVLEPIRTIAPFGEFNGGIFVGGS
ncbi:cadherin domain-containing protein [Tuwongella immobilis]|uniref:Cadherin domain-containing protein n=1 Tax=Tuwongella immobilis TaxID=692036 RepID=A0A6C2YT55_9BACT